MVKLILITAIIVFCGLFFSVFCQKTYGPYYLLNEKVEPRHYTKEIAGREVPVTYHIDLRSNRSNYEDKRIFATFDFHEDCGPIGMQYEIFWDVGQDDWRSQGIAISIPNVCLTGYGIKFFRKHFTGEIDRLKCTIAAGRYALNNFTVEDDLHEKFEVLYYRRYKIIMCLSNNPGFTDCFIKLEVIAAVKDANKAKQKKRPSSHHQQSVFGLGGE